MRVKVHGKDVSVSPRTEELISEKLGFLDKYLIISDEDIANCILKKVGSRIRIEITIQTKIGLIRAEVTDNDLRCALDEACDRLERQIVAQKERLNRRHKASLAKSFALSDEKPASDEAPVRTKWLVAQKMSADEAILQMEMTGHSFFIFTDQDTLKINVVYRRSAGGYGLIEVQPDK